MISIESVGSFLLYFGTALVLEAIFLALYMALTPHKEIALIKAGNSAAAISMGGAVLGFTFPLASLIVHSVSLLEVLAWGAVALLIQLAVYLGANYALRELSRRIVEGNIAAATMLAALSLATGILNAASMS